MGWVIFKDKQGSGYVYDSMYEMQSQLRSLPVKVAGETIEAGCYTTLSGHFSRPIKYLGLKDNREMIFLIGQSYDLFYQKYLFQSISRIDEFRIFEMYGANSGRDFYYINGKWK